MANNRMEIRCRVCGETIILARCGLGSYSCYPDIENKMNEFFEKHLFCERERKQYCGQPELPPKDQVYWDNQFDITYEYSHQMGEESEGVNDE